MSRPLSTILVAPLLLALTSSAAQAATCYDFQELGVPDGDGGEYPGVSWWGINNDDVLVGNYCLDETCEEVGGVIYDSAMDSYEHFVIEGYGGRLDTPRINDRGQIVGSTTSVDGSAFTSFVRDADGTVTLLDHLDGFVAMDINNRGDIVGYFTGDGWPFWSGATVSGRGYTEVEYYDGAYSSEYGTALWGSNDRGDLLPSFEGISGWWLDYVAAIEFHRGLEIIDWSDAGDYDGGTAWGLNNRGVTVGSLYDSSTGDHPGFIKPPGGDYTEVWYDAGWTALLDISDHGVIAGTFDYYDKGLVGWPVECDR